MRLKMAAIVKTHTEGREKPSSCIYLFATAKTASPLLQLLSQRSVLCAAHRIRARVFCFFRRNNFLYFPDHFTLRVAPDTGNKTSAFFLPTGSRYATYFGCVAQGEWNTLVSFPSIQNAVGYTGFSVPSAQPVCRQVIFNYAPSALPWLYKEDRTPKHSLESLNQQPKFKTTVVR